MSGGNIDELMMIWDTDASMQGGESPFVNCSDLYDTIDAIPVGGVPWQSFTVSYTGLLPGADIPPWMEQTYEIHFRDPHKIFQNMLANPTFAENFDYTPTRIFDINGSRRYENFMSGDWAWKQAVGFYICSFRFTNFGLRILSQTQYQMQTAQCSFPFSWAVIRLLRLPALDKLNTGPYMGRLETFITTSVVHMEVAWFS